MRAGRSALFAGTVWLTSAMAGQSGFEWVESAPTAPAPRITLKTGGENKEALLNVAARDGEGAPEVSASDPTGAPVPLENRGGGQYRIVGKNVGLLTVRAKSAGGSERSLKVYVGDFGAALRLLSADKPGGTVLEKEEWGQWLRMVAADWREQRLRELLETAEPAAAAGDAVEDYIYLKEVTQALKSSDVVRAYRGRELPIRIELPAQGARKAARFDVLLRLPASDENKAAPLLVRLHGRTDAPSLAGASLDVTKIGWEGEFPFVVVSPVCNKVMRVENWNTEEVAALVETLREKLPVDRDRTYVTGFSMGGCATLKLANERPDLFAAWAAVCGWTDVFDMGGLARRPGWLIHGDRDPAVPAYQSVRAYRVLRALGAPARLTLYRGVGHNSWDLIYHEARFYAWLLGQDGSGNLRSPVVPLEASEEFLVHDAPIALREALQDETLAKKTRELYGLFPASALTGELTLYAPQGLTSPDAGCWLGVPVRGDEPTPAGFKRMKLPKAEGKPLVRRTRFTPEAFAALAEGGDANAPALVRFGGWTARDPREGNVVWSRAQAEEPK